MMPAHDASLRHDVDFVDLHCPACLAAYDRMVELGLVTDWRRPGDRGGVHHLDRAVAGPTDRLAITALLAAALAVALVLLGIRKAVTR